MRTRMYGGVRGRKTKVGRKLTLFSSYSIIYDDSGGRVSLAWFRRNEFRLHPSHDFVAGPSRSRGHGRPRHPNLPYRLRCTRTIALLILWTTAIAANLAFTSLLPRYLNLLKLLSYFICPKTASGSIGRLLRCFIPSSLVISSLAIARSSLFLSFTQCNVKRKKVMKPKNTRMSSRTRTRHICVFLG